MSEQTFHIGLCMAGSVSAGAYTAGVMDYLLEALENWEKIRNTDASIPSHKVEIDLFGGTSGGGITAAMAFFAFRDKLQHPVLNSDRKKYQIDPEQNLLWKLWVNMTQENVFDKMLRLEDIKDYHIPSALNASFIDEVGDMFQDYIKNFTPKETQKPNFISEEAELFMTLFNVTGIKYQLNSKAFGPTEQYIPEHRDLAHFKWSDKYKKDGRMEISFNTTDNLKTLIQAAKATGAFPIGLKARKVARKAKYIWDNPFFQKNNKNKFNKNTINLGSQVVTDNDIYTSLNADGGTANNEPVELMRRLLLQIRFQEENNAKALEEVSSMDETELMVATSQKLINTSVILIDPFPSNDFDIKEKSEHIFPYASDLIFAMSSQLQFDAKEAIEAYDKDNYGLHVIAPSRDDVRPEHSIACGALSGFGGFLHKEFRIHDFFLGRHNCQSFLRKYFVVNPEEQEINPDGKPNENYACVKAVIDGYQDPAALERFCFTDENGKKWVPIIPDVTLSKPIQVRETKNTDKTKTVVYDEDNKLPLYKLDLLPNDFLEGYQDLVKDRINKLMKNVYDSNWLVRGIK